MDALLLLPLFEEPESNSYDDCRVGWEVAAFLRSKTLLVDFLAVSSLGITRKLEDWPVGLPASSKLLPCDLRLPNLMFLRVGAMMRMCRDFGSDEGWFRFEPRTVTISDCTKLI